MKARKSTINCKKEENILSALRRNGVTIKAFCNGRHTCGKCRVRIDSNDEALLNCLSEPGEAEKSLLSQDEINEGVRLACDCFFVKEVDSVAIEVLDELENGAPVLTETDNAVSVNKGQAYNMKTFAAIDIGTTTIALKLISDGKEITTLTRQNSQCSYGADVISRSEASIGGANEELKRCLIDDINKLLDECGTSEIEHIIIAANTTIVHLLKGYPLGEMVSYPFRPYYSGWHKEMFETTDNRQIPMTILPNLSAYIGADIIAGLYYCDFSSLNKVSLFIDLGTNGEMAIGNRDRILTASAAAGPAFEGTKINVATDVVKCMSELRKKGIIDENGMLKDPYFDSGYPYICRNNTPVIIGQRDIRDIQMAKSAIRSGIMLLIKNYGIDIEDIDKVFLAGGMGHSLDVASAVHIGLLPGELENKVVFVGNTSLAGCIKYGLMEYDDALVDKVLKVCGEITLSNEADFSNMYYSYMLFD